MPRYKLLVFTLLAMTVLTAVAAVASAAGAGEYFRRKLRERKREVAAQPIIGTTDEGSYEYGSDRIILVGTEFRGEFSESTVLKNFLAARDKLRYSDKTVVFGRYDRKLATDRHVVFGWYNVTRARFGYIGFRILSDGRSAQVIYDDNETEMINDWKYKYWKTNGYLVTLQICDDDKGGVAIIFHPIK